MSLLTPTSIAVIGASAQEGKVGHDVLRNIVSQGYPGKVFPVNPRYPELMGKRCFASVTEIPDEVDMAIIVTPAQTVAELAEECGKKKVKTLVVITAGFGEMGEEGKKREEEVKEIVLKYGMRLVGTNCLGLLRPSLRLNASFAKELPLAGNVALISQSGALAVALMDASMPLHLGFSVVLSVGNKTILDECDYLELCEADPETKVIGLYLESVKNGLLFREVAARVSRNKPIVLLKAGVSEAGKRAASSHTGALAGSDAAIEAVCAQTGVRRAESTADFLDMLRVLSTQPALLSQRIAIITNAGGPGILATDAASKHDLSLPSLKKEREEALKQTLPPAAAVKNPIDVLGDAGADRYEAALAACGEDPNIDGLCVLLTPQVMTPCTEIARKVIEAAARFPLMPVVTSFMGGDTVREAVGELQTNGIPNFENPERAVSALRSLWNMKHAGRITHVCGSGAGDRAKKAIALLQGASGLVPEETAKDLMELYGIPAPAQAIAKSAEEAVTLAGTMGLPVVLKVSSPDILHKTDVGGIRVNLKTSEEVSAAYTEIMNNVGTLAPKATVNGILVQRFLNVGNEFIVGAVRDPSFGTLIMAGLGGIYTELLRDTAFRLAPLTEEDAFSMLQSLKSWNILLGLRGKQQSDIATLACLLVTVSQLMLECPQIKELDLNPVLVDEKGVTIVDAKVVV